jgi:hypothetical protein
MLTKSSDQGERWGGVEARQVKEGCSPHLPGLHVPDIHSTNSGDDPALVNEAAEDFGFVVFESKSGRSIRSGTAPVYSGGRVDRHRSVLSMDSNRAFLYFQAMADVGVVDTTTLNGLLVANTMSAVAECERQMIGQRAKDARAEKRTEGADLELLTVAEAAGLVGVNPRTIRRRLHEPEVEGYGRRRPEALPNAHLDDAGVWQIPAADLWAAGFTRAEVDIHKSDLKPPDVSTRVVDFRVDSVVDSGGHFPEQEKSAESDREEWRRRAEIAEKLLAEVRERLVDRDRVIAAHIDTIDSLRVTVQTLRALGTGGATMTQDVTPMASTRMAPAPDQPDPDAAADFWVVDDEVKQEPRRRWWQPRD